MEILSILWEATAPLTLTIHHSFTKIDITMEASPKVERVIISPIAYIKSLLYFQRFSSEFIKETDFKFAYGLLLGYEDIDGKEYITDFFPIKHFEQEYIYFKDFDKVFTHLQKLNEDNYDAEYPEYVIGWARNSLHDDFEPTLIDKKNHLFFTSSINPKSFFWIFDHENLAIDDGIRLLTFKDDFKAASITSEIEKINYEFAKDAYIDDLIPIAINLEEKRNNQEIIMKGLEES